MKLDHGYRSDEETLAVPRLLGYQCGDLATAFFLGELLDHIATSRGLTGAEFARFTDVAEIEPIDEPQPLEIRKGASQ